MIWRRGGVGLAAMALVAALLSRPAFACSTGPGYKVPTGLALASAADTIVIARVNGERPGKDGSIGSVLAKPVTLLKGAALPPRIEIAEAILSNDRRMVFRSDPHELREPNAGALTGGCVRYAFAKGMLLVLFLGRSGEGRLVPIRATFARDAEDVTGPTALWVKAVQEYARIARQSRRDWPVSLRRRIVALRASGDADAIAVAADMEIEARDLHAGVTR